jgi:hypothetical protein
LRARGGGDALAVPVGDAVGVPLGVPLGVGVRGALAVLVALPERARVG